MSGIKTYLLGVLLLMMRGGIGSAQSISEGRIVFERKTNLVKKYKNEGMRDWLSEGKKIKKDSFELFFNDTASCFRPIESDLKETMSWATAKGSVYRNLKTGAVLRIRPILGEVFFYTDTLPFREWKITSSVRNICGMRCRKAIWQANDSTRIYAWFSEAFTLDGGPERFSGLPGMILGLALEDGSIIYFAKSVQVGPVKPVDLQFPKTRKTLYKSADLKKKIMTEMRNEKWMWDAIEDAFGIW